MPTRSDSRVNPARTKRVISLSVTLAAAVAMLAVFADRTQAQKEKLAERINANAQQMVDEGRQIFRFDTFASSPQLRPETSG